MSGVLKSSVCLRSCLQLLWASTAAPALPHGWAAHSSRYGVRRTQPVCDEITMEALVNVLADSTRALIARKDCSIEECTAAAACDLLRSSLFHDKVVDLCCVSTSPCAKDDNGA